MTECSPSDEGHPVGWPELIGLLIIIKERLARLDDHAPYGYRAPRIGATEDQLHELEKQIAGPLDPQHRELLAHINGWPDLYFSSELLSTAQLSDAALRAEVLEHSSQGSETYDELSWLPLARAVHDRDAVLIGRTGTEQSGEVVWLAGEVVDTYDDLEEWLLAVIEYHRRALARRGVVDLLAPG